ncbi:uncharacterized protein C6C3.02c isoform X3 [Manihot esculenta]|uniref:CHCH domain-containing protein n=1 Tax=Manihot esculenta TaxID=3983 RepID=A0A2C9U0X1_MANES|nr:uncharacterized protein C6C3.02c isoform X3 [Manihot esculenta]OAY23162.1 hypothetical protein MANES_18G056800v8 [Manihot esculenta]
MPRRSRNSGGSSGLRRPTATPLRNPPAPAAPAPAPPPAPVRGANGPVMGGFGAAVADGLAFGTGTAVAHRAVDAVLGPRIVHHETVTSSAPAATPVQNTNNFGDACGGQSKALQDCLNNYGSDISKCQFYMDMLQECRRGSGAALGA